MRNRISIYEPETIKNQRSNSLSLLQESPVKPSKINQLTDVLCEEGHESFHNYIEWIGLDKDPRIVILSSIHHFYYDVEEMKFIRTIVNLKELNLIRNLNTFIQSVSQIISPGSYFLGCFVDNTVKNGFISSENLLNNNSGIPSEDIENGISSRIPLLDKFYKLMDSKTNNTLSGKTVSHLLKDNRFKVIDITRLNSMTYFCAQKLNTIKI